MRVFNIPQEPLLLPPIQGETIFPTVLVPSKAARLEGGLGFVLHDVFSFLLGRVRNSQYVKVL